jgi:hypothetical protein
MEEDSEFQILKNFSATTRISKLLRLIDYN